MWALRVRHRSKDVNGAVAVACRAAMAGVVALVAVGAVRALLCKCAAVVVGAFAVGGNCGAPNIAKAAECARDVFCFAGFNDD